MVRCHALVFVLCDAIAGITGSRYALRRYNIVPEQFSFALLVDSLTTMVLGGRISVDGPAVGAVILAVLPELARTSADQRHLPHGALPMPATVCRPDGNVGTDRRVPPGPARVGSCVREPRGRGALT